MKIKICGISNLDDAKAASSLDIDYIGLIFIKESPRCVSITTAGKICKNIIKNKVGVFMNQSYDDIAKILKSVNLDILQFHGKEDKEFCLQFNKPFFKTIGVNDNNIEFYDESIEKFIIDTSIDAIDRTVEDQGYLIDLTLFSGGTIATATASVGTGYVSSIFLNDDGYGFTSAPTITSRHQYQPEPLLRLLLLPQPEITSLPSKKY